MNGYEWVAREKVKADLAIARWGDSSRAIAQATLWRWCDLLGIPTGGVLFERAHYEALIKLARHYRNGGTTEQILEEIGQ